jgi:hypothetical protein
LAFLRDLFRIHELKHVLGGDLILGFNFSSLLAALHQDFQSHELRVSDLIGVTIVSEVI